MSMIDNLPIIQEGVWYYANEAPVRVRILSSSETWGTGDYEDDESVAENQSIPCFVLAYEMAGSPGSFRNVIPNLMSLEAAVATAEQRFPGIQWINKTCSTG